MKRKQDIAERFSERAQAEHYRDRYVTGKRQSTHAREVRALGQLLDGVSGLTTVLDVASGPGRLEPLFAKHAQRVIQADFSRHMLNVSREDYPEISGGHVQADARQLPFADDTADLVFCHRLLNHLPEVKDRSRIVGQLARVSRRYVVVSCLAMPEIWRVWRRLRRWVTRSSTPEEHVEESQLLQDARQAGLVLAGRTLIRSGFVSSAFLTFEKKHNSAD